LPTNPTLVVRPSRQSYKQVGRSEGSLWDRVRTRLPLLLLVLVPGAVVLIYRLRDAPSVAAMVFAIALILLVVGGALGIREFTFSRARLEVDGNGVAFTSALGLRHRYRRADLKRVYLRSVESYTRRLHPLALFVGRSDRVLFRLWGDFWDASELDQVFSLLEVELDGSWSQKTTGWQLRRDAKSALPIWWWAFVWNPGLVGLGCGGLIILVVVLLTVGSAIHST
jgi:hypothetical protein